jgi:nucleoid-associated protein YgaU
VAISTASPSTINAIQQAVLAVQARVTVLIAAANAAIGTPTTFGGVTPGIPAATSALALSAATTNTMRLWTLMQLQRVLGRLMANLSAVNSSPNTVSTAGGNLYRIAQDTFGDPTAWATIAAANELIDPFIQGIETLTIPPQPGNSGGILSS